MTAPSELTNDQLRLAIAEIIAEEKGWTLQLAKPGGSDHWLTETGIKFVPNYLDDNNNNAALGLLDDSGEWRIGKVNDKLKGWVYWCAVGYEYAPEINGYAPKASGTSESLPRAISEAVYAAMKEK